MNKINTKELLARGVKEIIVKNNLEKALVSGKRLKLKLGIDPNIPELHLGHAVILRKLRAFQDLGHTAILILGDYTATIGDPSGKDKTRKALDAKKTKKNGKELLTQAFKILNPSKTEYHYNSEWFGKMTFLDVLNLASKMTVEHIMSHDTFSQRLKRKTPFFMHEIMYPLMQGYDSVMVKADVELGASEQKFNLLAGRRLQRAFGQKEQNILMMDYLPGTDGSEKMSKSLGNYISLRDSADNMFGKVMSIPDEVMKKYYFLATNLSANEIKQKLIEAKNNPKSAKEDLAYEIVRYYHCKKEADQARINFNMVFSQKKIPTKIPKYKVKAKNITIIGALVETEMVASRSEARRVIEQGGVQVNQKVVKDINFIIKLGKPVILQKGKKNFIKLIK